MAQSSSGSSASGLRVWEINVCSRCRKQLDTGGPDPCKCEPPAFGFTAHEQVEVVPLAALQEKEAALQVAADALELYLPRIENRIGREETVQRSEGPLQGYTDRSGAAARLAIERIAKASGG